MIKHLYLFVLFFVLAIVSKAQVQESGWLLVTGNFKINNKFSAYFDAQLRSTDNLEKVQTIILRPGLNYHINKSLTFTAGYAFIPNRRTVGTYSNLLAEHRIWEQLVFAHKVLSTTMSHRLRFEQRYIPVHTIQNNELETDSYDNAYRLRYFIRDIIPLAKQTGAFSKGWYLALQDEVLVNVGDRSAVNGKFFDQNRAYGAFGYRTTKKIDVEIGYMNQYVKTRTAFTNNHIAQLAIYKRL